MLIKCQIFIVCHTPGAFLQFSKKNLNYSTALSNKQTQASCLLHFLLELINFYLQFHLKSSNSNIIKYLNLKKIHGRNMMSMQMLTICGLALHKPIKTIYKSSLEIGIFSVDWKKTKSYYRPISLLSISRTVFEWLIYSKMFEFFMGNNLISQYLSRFKPEDSCVNKLLSITYYIYKSFDVDVKVKTVFQRYSIKCGIMVKFSSWNNLVFLGVFLDC